MSTVPSATAKSALPIAQPLAATDGVLHPAPGATATLIGDLRELFKFKVTFMVLITTWAGFYLGSMDSGISSVQRGLIETLFGVALVSAGASALNEAIERKTDAKMVRTANRPIAAGRISLWQGLLLGLGAVAAGGFWLQYATNQLTVGLALMTVFTYVAIYTPLKRMTTRPHSSEPSPEPPALSSAGPPPAGRSSGPVSPSSPSSSSGSSLTCWPSPGSTATTTPRPASKCSPSPSPTAFRPSSRPSSTPC